ncbi:MAG TPA: efflux RND transporter periplasmic adaptor subunit [Candidatus Binataceae bacterium]|nr:efflux RND transporter periplasmic adaptor subunit [Candidatus Binataceae bacterium]
MIRIRAIDSPRSERMRAAIVAALAALALACIPGCRQSAAAGAVSDAPQRLVVAVAQAHQQTITRTAEVQGALYPREQTVLSAEVEGAVVQVAADFGDTVEAGQVLMRIDPREYQLRLDSAGAALDQTRARLENSQAQYNRALELRKNGLISPEQFDTLASAMRVDQADAESAAKAVALARKKLDDTKIKAPFKGSVQKRMASLGEYVPVGRQLYELIATDPIKLDCPMPERFVPLARVGMPVRLTIDSRPGITYAGVITRIAPALDEQTRTLKIEAEVKNPDGALKPGLFAHVSMNLGQDRALVVPASAILRYAGVERVFVVKDGVVHTREVTTGAIVGDQIEIVSGLHADEQVVTTDVDRLADGTAVVAREQS